MNRGSEHGSNAKTGLARALSKLGFCSRSQGWELVRARRVKVNGMLRSDGEFRVDLGKDRLEVNGQLVRRAEKVYLMLNKPRGLLTTTNDEQGRKTVLECLAGHDLPFLAPVGRLDKASEGLLLFTNDTAWAASITDPASGIRKTYHVHIDRVADEGLVGQLRQGVQNEGEFLSVCSAGILRRGTNTSWLEIVLEEGKNRHLRRMLEVVGINVLRLVRVRIGPLVLGNLAKGQFRELMRGEVEALGRRAGEYLRPGGK